MGRRRCARQQPHANRGTTDGSVASQTKSCLTDTQANLPADQNGRGSTCLELKVCQAIPSPSSKITRPGLVDAGPLLPFCAQSIEITWIAAIPSGCFATETSRLNHLRELIGNDFRSVSCAKIA